METASDSGGRVTRALRKRLTSIDSDNGSSRPGTPVQPKLNTGATNSPIKTRMTRRHSTSGLGTPIKTPGKRAANTVTVIVEEENITPARRTTRRRSVSQIENEGTPKYEKKTQHFECLDEETPEARVTRSKSKSPEQVKALTRTIKSMARPKEDEKPSVSEQKDESSPTITTPRRRTRGVENTKESVVQNKTNDNKFNSPFPTSSKRKSLTAENIKAEKVMENDKNLDENNVKLESPLNSSKLIPIITQNVLNQDLESNNEGNSKLGLSLQKRESFSSASQNNEKEISTNPLNGQENNDSDLLEGHNKLSSPQKEKSCNPVEDEELFEKMEVEEENEENLHSNNQEMEKIVSSNHKVPQDVYKDGELDLNVLQSDNVTTQMQSHILDSGSAEIPETENLETIGNEEEVEANTSMLENNNTMDILKEQPTEGSIVENADMNNMEEKNISAVEEERADKSEQSNNNDTNSEKTNKSPQRSGNEVVPMTPDRNSTEMKTVNGAESLKKVVFSVIVSDDECEKSIYPKTPASAKSKSFKANKDNSDVDTSYQGAENESVILLNDTTGIEIPETQQEINVNKSVGDNGTVFEIEDDNELDEAKGSDVSRSKDGCIDLPEDESDVEVTVNDNVNLKWCKPSVIAKGSKLDTIVNEEIKELPKSPLVDTNLVKQNRKKTFLKRDEWKDNDDDESADDEEYEEEAEEEEDDDGEDKYNRKNPFHDDEAMVVDNDYQSGDSMDSEERRELMENEIPVDGESIGSHTSEEEENEDEESETDSFIVSDNCEEDENIQSSYSEFDEEVYKETKEKDNLEGEKRKTFRRIKAVSDTSSNEDDDFSNKSENKLHNSRKHLEEDLEEYSENSVEEVKIPEDINENIGIVVNEKLQNKSLNSSRLSDSARRLQSNDSKEKSDNSNDEKDIDKSRTEILRILNKSEKFNQSVRDINTDIDVSSDALATSNNKDTSHGSAQRNRSKMIKTSDSGAEEEEPSSTFRNESAVALSDKKKTKRMSLDSSKRSESFLGEESVTSEEYNENDNSYNYSDDEKENAVVENHSQKKVKYPQGLSVSFGNFNQQKNNISLQKKVLQRSFTIGVTVNGGELETEVIASKTKKPKAITTVSSSSPSASLSSNEDTDGDVLSSDDVRYLENTKHIPMGNPLVRTRRQSLALPTNPDMEIGAAVKGSTKSNKRKSLGVLLGNDFHPSQSFVDSLELRRAQLEHQTFKRKRLSKSFSGTAGDSSVVDIDVQHLHKRSKLVLDNSLAESLENTKPDSSLYLKVVGHSSTPHDKGNSNKLNNSGIRRILNRCDEILEAANRAKLEAKINYRKSKIRIPRKNKKRMQEQQSLSPGTKRDKVRAAPLSKEIKKRDKTKIAVTQALKASANIIAGKQRKQEADVVYKPPKRLSPDVLKTVAVLTQSSSNARKNKKEKIKEKDLECMNYSTPAGNVVEMLQSPQRKKKPKFIRLPTGNVCVEPLTPMKRTISTCKGMEFHESPLTPCGNGFKVRDLPLDCKDRKRNRNTDTVRKTALPTPHWTQSGLFMEEEIPFTRPLSSICQDRLTKESHLSHLHSNVANFKQTALRRSDIKRSTAREILQLRDRRQVNDHRH